MPILHTVFSLVHNFHTIKHHKPKSKNVCVTVTQTRSADRQTDRPAMCRCWDASQLLCQYETISSWRHLLQTLVTDHSSTSLDACRRPRPHRKWDAHPCIDWSIWATSLSSWAPQVRRPSSSLSLGCWGRCTVVTWKYPVSMLVSLSIYCLTKTSGLTVITLSTMPGRLQQVTDNYNCGLTICIHSSGKWNCNYLQLFFVKSLRKNRLTYLIPHILHIQSLKLTPFVDTEKLCAQNCIICHSANQRVLRHDSQYTECKEEFSHSRGFRYKWTMLGMFHMMD